MTTRHRTIASLLCAAGAVSILLAAEPRGATMRFYRDDPQQREPETQDASAVKGWDIDLFWDLAENLFSRPGDPTPDVKARNVNTIDEVADSNWFTNRVLTRPITIDEMKRGPLAGSGPAPGPFAVTSSKLAGVSPGFTMKDAKGDTWFVSFDANGHPDAATGAILVANKIFWALGYWQVENYLIRIQPSALTIADTATYTPMSGIKRALKQGDLDEVLRRSHRSDDGSYRAIAARAVPGRPLGGFRYYGTRPDDPNDIIPHEHRRELRALKVFGAWTNLVDMKAGNTLDTLITENGRSVVRHYLQDVGSTFGTAANGPHDYDEGWEHLFQGDVAWKRMVTLGFYLQPWQFAKYVNNASIGRFEGTYFDPTTWKPRAPTAAILRARADDTFWAARRVIAFTDEMLRAAAAEGQYHDERAAQLLADVLIERRNAIAHAYLPAINPVINFALDESGTLRFDNAAVAAAVAEEPSGGYVVHWARFDNATGAVMPFGTPTATVDRRATAPMALPTGPDAIVRARIAAVTPPRPEWSRPVDVYFRRSGSGWSVVGVERLPAN